MKWKIYTNKYYFQQGEYIVNAETEAEAIKQWEAYQEHPDDNICIELSQDYFELEDEQFDWCEVMEEPVEVQF
tara:strand:- start:166 stop:384 length:219 start_codon:yes stop_codon:yes gene_type:complete